MVELRGRDTRPDEVQTVERFSRPVSKPSNVIGFRQFRNQPRGRTIARVKRPEKSGELQQALCDNGPDTE